MTSKINSMGILMELLITTLVILFGSRIIPGIHTDGLTSAIIAAVVFAVANATIGTILRILTIPLNILTLGLTSFLIGALMIYLAGRLLTGFHVDNYTAAVLLALLLAVIKIIFSLF